eukprot:4460648-Pleurochrysis_carterae.AAC.1
MSLRGGRVAYAALSQRGGGVLRCRRHCVGARPALPEIGSSCKLSSCEMWRRQRSAERSMLREYDK